MHVTENQMVPLELIDGGLITLNYDRELEMALTRAWGREKKEAGVPAMSELKSGGGGARRMLTLEQVLEKVPVGKSTLRRMIKNKEFPGPHFISPRKMVWYDDEVEDWQADLPRTKAAASKRK